MGAESPSPRTPSPSLPPVQRDRFPGRGGAAAGLLLYALLADAAIETLWSGSPLRWWVLAVVAIYLGATIVMWRGLPAVWRRIDWSGRAVASVFVGLGLLGLTVWIPGGLERGVRLLGLSTPAVLALVAALATVLAAVMLVSSPSVPRAGKWIVGLLSAYGVLAFVLGAVAQIPYTTLLNGGGFWARLPRAMQGPFIAGWILLPLALVVEIVDRLLRSRAAPPQPWGFRQITSLVLVVVMATAGLQVPRTTASAAVERSPAGKAAAAGCGGDCGHASAATILAPFEKASADFKRLATLTADGTKLTGLQAKARLDYLFDAMDAARKQIPRETFDPKAVVDRIGTDARALFAWTQNNTALVPYRGVLRGPVGVLMDRVGNSLDRSLLLAELLRLSGQKSRLAHATLTEAQARTLAAALTGAPPAAAHSSSADSGAALDRFVEDYGKHFQLDARTARDNAAELRRQSAQAAAAASERVAQQTRFIEKALGDLVPRDTRLDPGLLEDLRDHWWVQAQQNDGWADMDLAVPGGDVGRAIAPRAETADIGGVSADLFHAVTIRAVIERWTPDGVDKRTVLEQTIRPLDVLGRSIMLRHVPMSWPDDLDLSKEKDPLERVQSLVRDEAEWLPELVIGSERISRSSFRDDGEINASPGRRRAPGSPVGGSVGALFGGFAAGESQPGAGNGLLSAEWVEFDIRTPGRPPRTIRRDVFDLIGPAARAAKDWSHASSIGSRRLERGLALARETEVLVLGWNLSPDYIAEVSANGLLAQRTILSQLMVTTDRRGLRKLALAAAAGPLPASRLFGFALARPALGNDRGQVFLDEPNVFVLNAGVRPATEKQFVAYREFDIVHNGVGALPARGGSAFLVRLRQGVADTNAEALSSSTCCGDLSGNSSQTVRVVNAAEELAATIDKGSDWFVAKTGEDISAERIDLSPDVRTRLQDELAGGSVLLLNRNRTGRSPQNPMSGWRIDADTGAAVGLGENGTGQHATEYTIIVAKVGLMVSCSLNVQSAAMEPGAASPAELECRRNVCATMGIVTLFTIAFPLVLLHGLALAAAVFSGVTFIAEIGAEYNKEIDCEALGDK